MLGFGRKSSETPLSGIAAWLGWGRTSTASVAVTEESALMVPAVFAACRVIAEGIAQMPQRVIADTIDAAGVVRSAVQQDHWAHRLLANKPNGWQTPYEFVEGMVFNAAIGAGGLAIKSMVNGEVRELFPVPCNAWSVVQNPDWSLSIRVSYVGGQSGLFDASEVFFLRGPGLNGHCALPVIRAARDAIGLAKVLETQQSRLAANGGKPSGILAFGNALAPATKDKLRQTWEEKFGASGNGGIAVLDGDAKFTSMTMTGVDAQHLETRRFQIEEIARAFRVQPIMLMQPQAGGFSSAEQMFRNHVIHTLGPWMARWEGAANRDILANLPGLRVDLDERNLLRGDFKDQAEYYAKALGAGGTPAWMTANEVRHEVGLPPVDEEFAGKLSQGAMDPAGRVAAPPAAA